MTRSRITRRCGLAAAARDRPVRRKNRAICELRGLPDGRAPAFEGIVILVMRPGSFAEARDAEPGERSGIIIEVSSGLHALTPRFWLPSAGIPAIVKASRKFTKMRG